MHCINSEPDWVWCEIFTSPQNVCFLLYRVDPPEAAPCELNAFGLSTNPPSARLCDLSGVTGRRLRNEHPPRSTAALRLGQQSIVGAKETRRVAVISASTPTIQQAVLHVSLCVRMFASGWSQTVNIASTRRPDSLTRKHAAVYYFGQKNTTVEKRRRRSVCVCVCVCVCVRKGGEGV